MPYVKWGGFQHSRTRANLMAIIFEYFLWGRRRSSTPDKEASGYFGNGRGTAMIIRAADESSGLKSSTSNFRAGR